jgi:thymidylate synthase
MGNLEYSEKKRISGNSRVVAFTATRLYELIDNEHFVVDKNGGKTVELIDHRLVFKPALGPNINLYDMRKTPEKYVQQELDWYLSQDLSIFPKMAHVKIWNDVATKNDKQEINSNYGWCVFSNENHNQYEHCLKELIANKATRRAVMLYTRPSMWEDWQREGMRDFICTDGVQCFIRDNRLTYIVKQRSCDFIFGLFNDYAWHQYVCMKLLRDLKEIGHYDLLEEDVEIIYHPFSLHVYERHFDLVKKIGQKYYDDRI